MTKQILLIDDHDIVREGLVRIFADEPGTFQFGHARTAPQALELAARQPWDLAILDLTLGERNGLNVLSSIKEIRPRLPILVLTMHAEDQFVRRALKCGAIGYVTKDRPRMEVSEAIQNALRGRHFVSLAIAEKLIFDLHSESNALPHESLSNRELEVMMLLANGSSISDIASALCLSGKTISTYRTRILEKTGFRSNADLTRYALEHSLIA